MCETRSVNLDDSVELLHSFGTLITTTCGHCHSQKEGPCLKDACLKLRHNGAEVSVVLRDCDPDEAVRYYDRDGQHTTFPEAQSQAEAIYLALARMFGDNP